MKVGIAGNDDFVTGFLLAGVKDVFVGNGKNMDEKIVEALNCKELGVLVLDETDVSKTSFKTKQLIEKTVTPVVITLSSESTGTDLRNLIKRSIGVDLWK